MWCCMASLAHTTSSPDGSRTATGSGLDSSTRVNSWARRVSSTSSETSATVSSAPPGPPGPVRGTVDRSSHREVPSSFSRRRRPWRATPATRARRRSAKNSGRPSGAMIVVQPSPWAPTGSWPVACPHRALTRTSRPSASRRAIPDGAASTSASRTRRSDVSGDGSVTCGRGDSNPHASRRRLLKPVRLPVPPRPRL